MMNKFIQTNMSYHQQYFLELEFSKNVCFKMKFSQLVDIMIYFN